LLIQPILRVRRALGSIRDVTEISLGKFRDEEYGDFFRRFIRKKIDISDLLLNSLLNYIKASTPIEKTNTVHTLIEQVVTKYRAQLEEKNIGTTETFEENLPETTVPDEQLKYILNCVVLYAVASTPPNGSIEFITKSFGLKRGVAGVQGFFEKVGRYTEIRVAFSRDAKPAGWSGRTSERIPSRHKGEGLDLLLRLAKELVLRNQGIIKFQRDEEKAKMIISLSFPAERRRVFFYESV